MSSVHQGETKSALQISTEPWNRSEEEIRQSKRARKKRKAAAKLQKIRAHKREKQQKRKEERVMDPVSRASRGLQRDGDDEEQEEEKAEGVDGASGDNEDQIAAASSTSGGVDTRDECRGEVRDASRTAADEDKAKARDRKKRRMT